MTRSSGRNTKKVCKIVLLIATLCPHVIYITYIGSIILEFSIPFALLIIISILYLSLLMIYLIIIIKNKHMEKDVKFAWIIGLFFPGIGVYLIMPIYWAFYIWSEQWEVPPTRSPKTLSS